ncbi:hypothetical protein ACFC26_14820 [Kitasatospora purpeofusca]|uniref:hypothetical protein n=1 Tax=Kitasatospora purpeofusca TaxID=67352 RepID=UPI0035DECF4D
MNDTTVPTDPDPGLARFTQALAERLPGTWTAEELDISSDTARSDLQDRLWDRGHTAWALEAIASDRAGIVSDGEDRSLLVLRRPHPQNSQFLVAPLLPALLGTAYDFEDITPNGIAVDESPTRAAFAVRVRLLPRYTDALHTATARAISEYTPSRSELAEDSPDRSRWHSDPREVQLIREAVSDLLRVASLRFDDEQTGVSHVLAGGAEFICDRNELDPNLVQVVEDAALTAVLDAAGLPVSSVLDPALPAFLERVESWPAERQREVMQHAAAALRAPVPERADAALARTTAHPAAPIRSASAAPQPTATLPDTGRRPARPNL